MGEIWLWAFVFGGGGYIIDFRCIKDLLGGFGGFLGWAAFISFFWVFWGGVRYLWGGGTPPNNRNERNMLSPATVSYTHLTLPTNREV